MTEKPRWRPPDIDRQLFSSLKQRFPDDPLLLEILIRQGISTSEGLRYFFENDIYRLRSPFKMSGIHAVLSSLHSAVEKRKKILVYGDMDVDGICSTAIAVDFLRRYNDSISYFIPTRDEGYGITENTIPKIKNLSPDLLVCVDCGTSNAAEIAQLKNAGIETVVIDHHIPPDVSPAVNGFVNPQQQSCPYPFKDFCAAGLVFMVCLAYLVQNEDGFTKIRGSTDYEVFVRQYIDLAMLATLADVVPIHEENRLLVVNGLLQIRQTRHPGIKALFDTGDINLNTCDSQTIQFKIAPALNACGRMEQATIGLSLLLEHDIEKGREQAAYIWELNNRRKKEQSQGYMLAKEKIDTAQLQQNMCIITGDKRIDKGVVGIIAAKLSENYHRPVLLFSCQDRDIWTASGRASGNINLINELRHFEKLFERYGGHKYAVGLSLSQGVYDHFLKTAVTHFNNSFSSADFRSEYFIDAELPLNNLCLRQVESLERIAPIMLTSQLLFVAYHIEVNSFRFIGQNDQHMKCSFIENPHLEGLIWNITEEQKRLMTEKYPLDILFHIKINHWRNKKTPQLDIRAITASQSGTHETN